MGGIVTEKVGISVGKGVAVGVGVGVAVDVGTGAGVFSFSLPQAANIGTIKTKPRSRTMNLYHKLLFGQMVNHLLLRHRPNNKGPARYLPN